MAEIIDQIAQAIIDAGYNPATAKPIAKIALNAIDLDKKANCKHVNRTGVGSLGSNMNWYCRDCGAAFKSDILGT